MFPNLVTYHIHRQEPLRSSDALAYQYILAGNSLFIRTETRFFSVLMPIATTIVHGLPSLAFEFQLKIPLLPVSLLSNVLTNARLARNADGRLNEVLYHLHHNGRSVQLIKPPQQTTAVSIAAPDAPTDTLLCDLHSHGNMAAFWSDTDNSDEQAARLYAVIGHLDTQPEMLLRVGCYGYWHPLPLTAVFDPAQSPFPFIDRNVHPPKTKPLM